MERYFINGLEVSKADAEKQERKNKEIMSIDDLEEWLKAAKDANFIIKIRR